MGFLILAKGSRHHQASSFGGQTESSVPSLLSPSITIATWEVKQPLIKTKVVPQTITLYVRALVLKEGLLGDPMTGELTESVDADRTLPQPIKRGCEVAGSLRTENPSVGAFE